MDWVKAEVHDVGLFKDDYACAILGKPGMKVVGCILSCKEPQKWKKRFEEYDYIEGFHEGGDKNDNYYQRDKVKAKLIESGEEVEVWMYNNPEGNQDV